MTNRVAMWRAGGWLALLCVVAVTRAQAAEPSGTVEGRITYVGEVPRMKLADHEGRRDPLLEVQRANGGLRYVVVHLERDGTTQSSTTAADRVDTSRSLVIDQLEYRFRPRIVAVRAGEVVAFTNSDSANHNVRASSLIGQNQFNVLTSALGRYEHRFQIDPKQRPILIGCDIHGWMQAWIYVFDHPYFDVTDTEGKFCLNRVPVGNHMLVVRQPDAGFQRKLLATVRVDAMTSLTLEFTESALPSD